MVVYMYVVLLFFSDFYCTVCCIVKGKIVISKSNNNLL